MIIQVFQLFLFVPNSRQSLFVGDDFHIHRSGNGERELLLLIIKYLAWRKIQLTHDIVNREVGNKSCLIFTLNL